MMKGARQIKPLHMRHTWMAQAAAHGRDVSLQGRFTAQCNWKRLQCSSCPELGHVQAFPGADGAALQFVLDH